MNDYANAIEALEPALDALVDLCNNSASMSNESAVIAAEAALERVYKSRNVETAALEKVRAAAPLLLDALRQWAAAERDGDAEELENARASRNAAIAAATN